MSYQFDVRLSAIDPRGAPIKINHAAFAMTRDDARHETVEYYSKANFTSITIEHIAKVCIANLLSFEFGEYTRQRARRSKKRKVKEQTTPRITGNDPVIIPDDCREPEGGWANYSEYHPDWGRY